MPAVTFSPPEGMEMSSDPNKKSARTFQCRDVLWETFEQMARELECSVDYLINEAMKQYARQRSYGTRTPFPASGRAEGQSASPPEVRPGGFGGSTMPLGGPPPGMRATGGPAPAPAAARSPAPAPARSGAPGGMGAPLPPPPASRQSAMPAPPSRGGYGVPPVPGGRTAPPPMPPRSVPPPIPRGNTPLPPVANGFPAAQSQSATLHVLYQGEKVPVTKDRFVIGRGKQSSDLTLRDPNVSRQHAMIEFQNGVYFMVDMGSTNGVEYNGQRIARKQIAEGDVFKICDHDLLFTYQ